MKKYSGLTLIELMIAMVLGIIVIAGALSIYVATIQGSSDTVKSARLNNDLDSTMQVMVNDIRRAGYWNLAIAGSNARINPFTEAGNIQISSKTGEAANSCILYTYEDGELDGVNDTDTTDNGVLDSDLLGNGTLDLAEHYGFRLNGDGIDMLINSTVVSTDCNNGPWLSIINTDKIEIEKLEFTMENSQCFNKTTNTLYAGSGSPLNTSCPAIPSAGFSVTGDVLVETRQVDITLEGEADNDVIKTLFAIAKVRNNRIFD